ncbi:CynX/NimT family MFS transporter [Shewanella atlantica]|uniref:MFS transporter n=1 Tax=Shewanella atlantica TaxID=271099 RepID=A0A3S0IAD8_9GAMM|nr:CynX/NimT family MFS transporter [Shewanella atlantica]RTR28231.1 MFS transporter [Shewanella atlantica]
MKRSTQSGLLIAGILLIAANLRAPITGVAPLLSMLSESLQLSTTQAGLLTTLPLLAFAIVSPIASYLAKEYGLEPSIMGALSIIALGILIRSSGSVTALYLGTVILGCGIAIGNVLLPSLLKRDFPARIATFTAVYALTMGVGSAIGSAVAVPLAQFHDNGWAFSMGSFIVIPLLSMALWLPQMRNHTQPSEDTRGLPRGGKVWRSPLAWQVTFFLGFNSFISYIIIGWLPTILIDAGYSASQAGAMHGLLQLSTAIPGLLLIPVLGRLKDQRGLAFSVSAAAMLSILGLLYLPQLAMLWTVIFGFGAGAGLILGLSFISLRTDNPHQAAALSGMSQSVGYLLAATGPALVGSIYSVTNSWETPLALCASACGLCALFGLYAGRGLTINGQQSAGSEKVIVVS